MLSILLGVAAIAQVAVAGFPSELLQERQSGSGGFAIQNWKNDLAKVNFTSGDAGAFKVEWSNGFGGNFVVGKGYRPATDMLLNYTGEFNVDGWAYLAFYGWTTSPLVEYYVIEAMGEHNPSDNVSATLYGHMESDGGTYEVWQKERINAPSIMGDRTNFQQYWSVRTKQRVGGTINTGNHFRAWEKLGLPLGRQNYMVMGIEGQQGSGNADITVGVFPTTSIVEYPTSTYRSIRRTTTRSPTPIPTNWGMTSSSRRSTTTTARTTVRTTARTTVRTTTSPASEPTEEPSEPTVAPTTRRTSTRRPTPTTRPPPEDPEDEDGDDDDDDNWPWDDGSVAQGPGEKL